MLALPEVCHTFPKLKQSMQTFKCHPPGYPSRDRCTLTEPSIPEHIFIRHDAVQKPLQAPYDGPYKVLERKGKSYILRINGQERTVSLDRLKPAHLDPGQGVTTPTCTSRSDTFVTNSHHILVNTHPRLTNSHSPSYSHSHSFRASCSLVTTPSRLYPVTFMPSLERE